MQPERSAAPPFSQPVANALIAWGYTTRVTGRLETISTLAWCRQPLGERTSLVYSAGLGFGIARSESTYTSFGDLGGFTLPARTTEYTSYAINPVVGLEARIVMTSHASLVPGIRLIGADGGILIRPAVGLRWQF